MIKRKLKNILLVDDDDACNFFHKRLLSKLNVTENISIAHDGKEALDYLINLKNSGENRPEIIFLDINMPRLNGWDFLEEYKKLDETLKANLVLIMLTTSLNPDDAKKAQTYPFVKGFKSKFLKDNDIMDVLNEYFS